MAISNIREFEAVLSAVRMDVDRIAHSSGVPVSVDKARRELSIVHDAVKANEELTPALVKRFEEAAAVIRERVANEKMTDQLYDLSDYLEFGRSP